MQDADFEVLKVRASICPGSADWPQPDFSKVSIAGDRPHVDAGELHWAALHCAKDEARDRLLKTLGTMSGIDDNKKISRLPGSSTRSEKPRKQP